VENQENLWTKLESLLRAYKEFWFFLAGLLLGYLLHAIA
jgi:hypothetical protein